MPGGLIDPEGRRLAAAELRPLTGAEEEWLAANPGVPSTQAVTRLLSACLVRLNDVAADVDLVRSLLVGDRDYLMLQLRLITLGDKIGAVLNCPACHAKMDVDFAVRDVLVESRPQTTATYRLELDGRVVWFRLPTGGDQEAVLHQDPETAADDLLARCLEDDGGVRLSLANRSAVAAAMDRLAPQLDLELDLTCPECAHGFVAPFDTTAFFLQEMRMGGERLLREVHLLAFHYHWSEGEILSLHRDRRRGYLAILSDALHPE